MKIIKNVPILPACILSSITNILFILKIVPELVFRIGFMIVIISSFVMNLRTTINNRKEREISSNTPKKEVEEIKKPLYGYPLIIALVLWIITYCAAAFILFK